jgi:hypothetical protein
MLAFTMKTVIRLLIIAVFVNTSACLEYGSVLIPLPCQQGIPKIHCVMPITYSQGDGIDSSSCYISQLNAEAKWDLTLTIGEDPKQYQIFPTLAEKEVLIAGKYVPFLLKSIGDGESKDNIWIGYIDVGFELSPDNNSGIFVPSKDKRYLELKVRNLSNPESKEFTKCFDFSWRK